MLDERLISEIVASVVKSTMGTPNKQKGVYTHQKLHFV